MKKLLPFLFLAACSITTAQDTIRVCTYNVLNYSFTNEDGREAKFERIFRAIKPDILIVQELADVLSNQRLLHSYSRALGGGQVGFATFNNGPDTDNMLYYNPKKIKFGAIGASYYATELRNIAHYTVALENSNDSLHIISVHLKAGDTEMDEIQRTNEIMTLKNNMPMGSGDNVIVAGDFNFYSPEEVPYTMLTNTPFQRLVDPLGPWERNSTQYLNFYTQSPRMEPDEGCGGGTGGGMDDRFDFILHSEALSDNFVKGSYAVLGNDGVDRRNAPINNPPNTKVSSQIADDLVCASDHLPVYADFVFNTPTSINDVNLVNEISFNETSEKISISLPLLGTVTVVDILGKIVLKEYVDSQLSLNKNSLQNGMYYIQVGSGEQSKQFKFIVTE